ncbi:MAG TPA: IclR family transcriptional regulator [Bacillota bacterium]
MSDGGLKTLERALELLERFAGDPERDWSLTELADQAGLHKTTMLRLVKTLTRRGYLVRDEDSRRYRLGPMALVIGSAAAAGMSLRRVAVPVLRRLTEETGETCMINVRWGLEAVCIERVDGRNPVRVTYEMGRRGPLHAGSSGKTLLAFLPPHELAALLPQLPLDRYTDQTITDRQALAAELEAIRRRGYCTSRGELDPGVCAVGAPIWDHEGRLAAGLTVVGPCHRWSGDHWRELARAVQEAARQISAGLGYVDHHWRSERRRQP